MRDGITKKEIFAASRAEVERHGTKVNASLGKKFVEELLAQGDQPWHIHGVGLESAEPMFAMDEQAFYLEDMILITKDGHEILSTGLPYTAAEIEKAMRE